MALVVLGLANIAAALYLFRRLPANFLAFFLRLLWRALFRLEVEGIENLPRPGERAVIAVNNVSVLDAPILLSIMEEAPLFAIDLGLAQHVVDPIPAEALWRQSGRSSPAVDGARAYQQKRAPAGRWRCFRKGASR